MRLLVEVLRQRWQEKAVRHSSYAVSSANVLTRSKTSAVTFLQRNNCKSLTRFGYRWQRLAERHERHENRIFWIDLPYQSDMRNGGFLVGPDLYCLSEKFNDIDESS